MSRRQESQSPGRDEDRSSAFHRGNAFDNHDFQVENSVHVHTAALREAFLYHESVRKNAESALIIHEAAEAHRRAQLRVDQEEEKLRLETARAEAECRLRDLENKARMIPKPAPRLPTPPPALPERRPSPPPAQSVPEVAANTPTPSAQPAAQSQSVAVPANPFGQQVAPQTAAVQTNPFGQQASSQSPAPTSQHIAPTPAPAQPSAQTIQPRQAVAQASARPVTSQNPLMDGAVDYVRIHQNLKQLRKNFDDNIFKSNKEFRTKAGDMRRAIRKYMGQLAIGPPGTNKLQITNIMKVLKEARLDSNFPIDPSPYLIIKPDAPPATEPVPALFIYVLSHLAKIVVKQCAEEVSVNTAQADPIGVVIAFAFSSPDLFWQNRSLIDIVMAKFRASCPVLFGLRGKESSEEGRLRLGWQRNKDNRAWLNEAEHLERMTGIGAGYAAISLRDFSKVTKINPWPPSRYWWTLASITSTPPDQTSLTQYAVLRGMIQGYEDKFLAMYGTAGRAALQIALVDFPGKAVVQNAAVDNLKVLRHAMNKDWNFTLQPALNVW